MTQYGQHLVLYVQFYPRLWVPQYKTTMPAETASLWESIPLTIPMLLYSVVPTAGLLGPLRVSELCSSHFELNVHPLKLRRLWKYSFKMAVELSWNNKLRKLRFYGNLIMFLSKPRGLSWPSFFFFFLLGGLTTGVLSWGGGGRGRGWVQKEGMKTGSTICKHVSFHLHSSQLRPALMGCTFRPPEGFPPTTPLCHSMVKRLTLILNPQISPACISWWLWWFMIFCISISIFKKTQVPPRSTRTRKICLAAKILFSRFPSMHSIYLSILQTYPSLCCWANVGYSSPSPYK